MKKILGLAFVGLISMAQIAVADVIPSSLVGKWFFDGFDPTTYTSPAVVTFDKNGNFSEYTTFVKTEFNVGDRKEVSCVARFTGAIESVKQTPKGYELLAKSNAVDSVYPMAGSTAQECQQLTVKDFLDVDYKILNLKEHDSFELGGSVYKKLA